MNETDKVIERVIREANKLSRSKKSITTFTSAETGQIFHVLTAEQLRVLGVDTSNSKEVKL